MTAQRNTEVILFDMGGTLEHVYFDEETRLAATVTVALLANAFVCGALSGPHDRYGARMVWIATLTAVIAIMQVVESLVADSARRARAQTG